MAAWKSLEAYAQFVCGWVGELKIKVFGDNTMVTCKVMHSQKLSEKHPQAWIIAEKNGKVLTAHCTCMAGLAEACTHVGALLFKVDAAVRIRDSKTVTDDKAYWLLPSSKTGVTYSPVSDIDFTSAKSKKKKLDNQIDQLSACSAATDPQKTPVQAKKRSDAQAPSESELQELFSNLSLCDSKPAILALISPFSDNYVPKSLQPDFPPLLTELYDEKYEELEYEELLEYCQGIDVTVTSDQVKVVEEATRDQSDSKTWFGFRSGLVTASRLKAVCRTNPEKPSASLIKSICYPEQFRFKSASTQWGCHHQNIARQQYIGLKSSQGHNNLKFSPAGFVINEGSPFIGGSSDGFVSCDCCGEGCYEIKCPYCFKEEKIEGIVDKSFCLQMNESGTKHLQKKHQYFYQVQCQIFTCKKEFCDFIVWTEQDTMNSGKVQSVLQNTFSRSICYLSLQASFTLIHMLL